eukprot:6487453-Amphidinium_carterae.2
MQDSDTFAWADSSDTPTCLVLNLSSRSPRVPCLPVAKKEAARPLLCLCVPSGVVPAARIKARAGPIYKRVTVPLPMCDSEGYELLNEEDGSPTEVPADLLLTSPELYPSLSEG